ERLAVDELENDVGGGAGVGGIDAGVCAGRGLLAGVDDGDDVRVRELRDGAGLAPEALELVGVGGDLAMHELDRDGALEHGVERPVDGGHAAAPDLRLEAIAPAEKGPEDCHLALRRIISAASSTR